MAAPQQPRPDMAQWAETEDARRAAADRMARHFAAMNARRMRASWWIIPAIVLGAVGWAALAVILWALWRVNG